MKTVNKKIEVSSYPYGRLRTKAFFSIEWKKGKGYRSVFQTENPKTGKLNAEKKSTYSDLLYLEQDEKGFVSVQGLSFNGFNEINKALLFIENNKQLFTEDQLQSFALSFIFYSKVSVQAQVVYCGTDFEMLKPLIDQQVKNFVSISKGENVSFCDCLFDIEKIEALKVPNFNPFKVTTYQTI